MAITPNLMKQKLARGELVVGLGVRHFQTVEIGMIARAADIVLREARGFGHNTFKIDLVRPQIQPGVRTVEIKTGGIS